jgi:hypothetical protein
MAAGAAGVPRGLVPEVRFSLSMAEAKALFSEENVLYKNADKALYDKLLNDAKNERSVPSPTVMIDRYGYVGLAWPTSKGEETLRFALCFGNAFFEFTDLGASHLNQIDKSEKNPVVHTRDDPTKDLFLDCGVFREKAVRFSGLLSDDGLTKILTGATDHDNQQRFKQIEFTFDVSHEDGVFKRITWKAGHAYYNKIGQRHRGSPQPNILSCVSKQLSLVSEEVEDASKWTLTGALSDMNQNLFEETQPCPVASALTPVELMGAGTPRLRRMATVHRKTQQQRKTEDDVTVAAREVQCFAHRLYPGELQWALFAGHKSNATRANRIDAPPQRRQRNRDDDEDDEDDEAEEEEEVAVPPPPRNRNRKANIGVAEPVKRVRKRDSGMFMEETDGAEPTTPYASRLSLPFNKVALGKVDMSWNQTAIGFAGERSADWNKTYAPKNELMLDGSAKRYVEVADANEDVMRNASWYDSHDDGDYIFGVLGGAAAATRAAEIERASTTFNSNNLGRLDVAHNTSLWSVVGVMAHSITECLAAESIRARDLAPGPARNELALDKYFEEWENQEVPMDEAKRSETQSASFKACYLTCAEATQWRSATDFDDLDTPPPNPADGEPRKNYVCSDTVPVPTDNDKEIAINGANPADFDRDDRPLYSWWCCKSYQKTSDLQVDLISHNAAQPTRRHVCQTLTSTAQAFGLNLFFSAHCAFSHKESAVVKDAVEWQGLTPNVDLKCRVEATEIPIVWPYGLFVKQNDKYPKSFSTRADSLYTIQQGAKKLRVLCEYKTLMECNKTNEGVAQRACLIDGRRQAAINALVFYFNTGVLCHYVAVVRATRARPVREAVVTAGAGFVREKDTKVQPVTAYVDWMRVDFRKDLSMLNVLDGMLKHMFGKPTVTLYTDDMYVIRDIQAMVTSVGIDPQKSTNALFKNQVFANLAVKFGLFAYGTALPQLDFGRKLRDAVLVRCEKQTREAQLSYDKNLDANGRMLLFVARRLAFVSQNPNTVMWTATAATTRSLVRRDIPDLAKTYWKESAMPGLLKQANPKADANSKRILLLAYAERTRQREFCSGMLVDELLYFFTERTDDRRKYTASNVPITVFVEPKEPGQKLTDFPLLVLRGSALKPDTIRVAPIPKEAVKLLACYFVSEKQLNVPSDGFIIERGAVQLKQVLPTRRGAIATLFNCGVPSVGTQVVAGKNNRRGRVLNALTYTEMKDMQHPHHETDEDTEEEEDEEDESHKSRRKKLNARVGREAQRCADAMAFWLHSFSKALPADRKFPKGEKPSAYVEVVRSAVNNYFELVTKGGEITILWPFHASVGPRDAVNGMGWNYVVTPERKDKHQTLAECLTTVFVRAIHRLVNQKVLLTLHGRSELEKKNTRPSSTLGDDGGDLQDRWTPVLIPNCRGNPREIKTRGKENLYKWWNSKQETAQDAQSDNNLTELARNEWHAVDGADLNIRRWNTTPCIPPTVPRGYDKDSTAPGDRPCDIFQHCSARPQWSQTALGMALSTPDTTADGQATCEAQNNQDNTFVYYLGHQLLAHAQAALAWEYREARSEYRKTSEFKKPGVLRADAARWQEFAEECRQKQSDAA